MKIQSVKLSLPSREVTNKDVLDLISDRSKLSDREIDPILREVEFFLKYSGSDRRYWLDEGETPIQLICDAAYAALDHAQIEKTDVDVVVYVGIGRGFLEPGGSYHVANALGMAGVECYDIIDACMSWTRALQQLQALFAAGVYRRALVVNAEFNMISGGAINPANFCLESKEQIEWTFPSFTLGEGATATVVCSDTVSKEAANPWVFKFGSRPDGADLCNIPIARYESYSIGSSLTGRNGVGRFTSFGSKLVEHGREGIINVMNELIEDVGVTDAAAIFTHASSKRDWDDFADELSLKHLLYPIYPRTGNLVSASIPGAISLALDEGTIKPGDDVVGWVGSAGMSFCAYKFRV